MEPDPTQPTTSYGQAAAPADAGYGVGATNGFAIAALVLGIIGVTAMPFIPSVLALIFGYKGRSEIDQSNGQQQGRGLAVAGIVLGWIGVVVCALAILFFAVAAIGLGVFAEFGP